jgi:nucleotide-binding universal stress UspA family protein
VVGNDFSELSRRAFDQALLTASLHDNAEVHVVYVEPEMWFGPPFTGRIEKAVDADTALGQVRALCAERVEALDDRLDKDHLRRVVAHFRRGSPAENIAQLASDLDADLVVVGSHGHRGLERLFLGSVAERVARLARCPVWIIRPKNHAKEDRVPEIEPPCADCVARREETGGAELWCKRHEERHYLSPHVYSYASNGVYSAETTAYEATPER